MAARLDVPGRLADGRDALARLVVYVSACQRLGYAHPDLTGYGGQVDDWYDGESGLDLCALDADCARLRGLADTAEEVLRAQCSACDGLTGAWRGAGADAATMFLRGHCDTAAAAVSRLHDAARACETLRDELWRVVDARVAATMAVDDRVGGERTVWLSAARAVAAGGGDRAAVEVVEQRMWPFVDSEIGGGWVSAMRSARDGAAAAYDAAVAAAGPDLSALFAIPGDFGPRPPAASPGPVSTPVLSPVAALPGAVLPTDVLPADVPGAAFDDRWTEPAPRGERAVFAGEAPFDESVPATGAGLPGDVGLPGDTALPGDFGLPEGGGLPGGGLGGGGLGGAGLGLGAIAERIADALTGLLGSSDAGVGDSPFGADTAVPAEEVADPGPADDSENAVDDGAPADGVVEPESAAAASASAEPVQEVSDETAEQVPAAGPDVAAEDSAPAEEMPPEPAVQPEAKTPCEIAAEELPQVGA